MKFSNITCHGIVSNKGMEFSFDIRELHALVLNNTMTCDIGTPCPGLKQYHDM
jgi:hypothetical protein